nr:MAG TPA: hypothetical protein [Caudoviricetes sp.]
MAFGRSSQRNRQNQGHKSDRLRVSVLRLSLEHLTHNFHFKSSSLPEMGNGLFFRVQVHQ